MNKKKVKPILYFILYLNFYKINVMQSLIYYYLRRVIAMAFESDFKFLIVVINNNEQELILMKSFVSLPLIININY